MDAPLQVLLAFAQILIPISLAFPTILAFVPRRATDTIVILLLVPILELWVTVIVAISQLLRTEAEAWIAGVAIVIAAFALTYAFVQIGASLLDWNASRSVVTPSAEEQVLTQILAEIRKSLGTGGDTSEDPAKKEAS